MTFRELVKEISKRTGPAYGAGPAGFKRLMHRLGNPQNSYRIIHVAGTNGKGSVCHMCSIILQAAGYKTGLFISPHLQSITERIQLNGRKISCAAFTRACEKVLAAEKEKLNFFEILTAAAFLYFAEKRVDWVVLETGLGGRKDPTNNCMPAACAITSVGLDHCQILGNTLAEIADEKAGIIKRGVPIFCPVLAPEALHKIRAVSGSRQASLHVVRLGHPFRLEKVNWKKHQMILQKGQERWRLGVLGEKQIQNACLVYQLCRRIGISEQAIKQGLESVQIPGRFEVKYRQGKIVILDGAHNPQAIENLVKFLQKSPWAHKVAVVCAFMADKDYMLMLRLLTKQATLYVTTLGDQRAAKLEQLRSVPLGGAQVEFFSRPSDALSAARRCSVILVTGSFYLVARLRRIIIK